MRGEEIGNPLAAQRSKNARSGWIPERVHVDDIVPGREPHRLLGKFARCGKGWPKKKGF